MGITDRFTTTRARTEQLAAPLSPEDQVVQSMPDASPTKWHRAHTTWFWETFLLADRADYTAFDPAFAYLFNSYYEQVGPRHTRADRGQITRPDNALVTEYRHHVDAAIVRLLDGHLDGDAIDLVELGVNHEEQHQELLLMDILDLFVRNPVKPSYTDTPARGSAAVELVWLKTAASEVEIGSAARSFCFDNELPRHHVLLTDHAVASRPVVSSEWLEFIDDGGYDDPLVWLSDGWATVQSEGWDAPAHWTRTDDGWFTHDLHGVRPVDDHEPVSHISYYEADAFARWAGARLPTEFEWEAAMPNAEMTSSTGVLHPVLASPGAGVDAPIGMGQVWEWTASAYLPYPGFEPAPGAVGEYNGKFMVNQHVLRGGSCLTTPGHSRPTYRNFFPPHTRWHCSGVRLAR